MKRILINATQEEELRVAMVDGQQLYNLDIESPGKEQKKANIYKGKITRVEPSLEAAFVDYGAERHGFLPMKEIARSYFPEGYTFKGRPSIKEVLKEGQEVVIQIEKEQRGQKGAALTTFVSLAGSYLVLMPNNPRAGGISRQIEGEERAELKDTMRHIHLPKGMGVIVRTAGVGKNEEELGWDLQVLVKLWEAILEVADERPAPFLIHQESDVIIRAIRDHLRPHIGEIVIDQKEAYERAVQHLRHVRPDFVNKIKLYEDKVVPLFNRFQIEGQIESAFQREVRLPSGGSIVIDPTEALISIDINSARATRGADIEETAFNTNLEAADEIARQLRLRDMGGLVVIDFIDMMVSKHQREVETRLKKALSNDRARIQVGRISRFGLMEMSRQRLRPSLGESSKIVCPRCTGHGRIRSVESLSLSVLRLLEEEATKPATYQVRATLPVEVATFLLNEKRDILGKLEKRHNAQILILPNPHMDTPHYEVDRLKRSETSEEASYEAVATAPELRYEPVLNKAENIEKPAIKGLPSDAVAPMPVVNKTSPAVTPSAENVKKPGFLTRIWNKLSGAEQPEQPPETTHRKQQNRRPNTRSTKNTQKNSRNQSQNNRNSNRRTASSNKTHNQHKTAPDNRQKQSSRSGKNQAQAQPQHRSPRQQQQKTDTTTPKQTQNKTTTQKQPKNSTPRPPRKSRESRRVRSAEPVEKLQQNLAENNAMEKTVSKTSNNKTSTQKNSTSSTGAGTVQAKTAEPLSETRQQSGKRPSRGEQTSPQKTARTKPAGASNEASETQELTKTEAKAKISKTTTETDHTEKTVVDKSEPETTTTEEVAPVQTNNNGQHEPKEKTSDAHSRRKRKVPSHLGGNRYKRSTIKAPMTDQIIPTPVERPKPKTVQSAIRTAIVETRITHYNEKIVKAKDPALSSHHQQQDQADKPAIENKTSAENTSIHNDETGSDNNQKVAEKVSRPPKAVTTSSENNSEENPAAVKANRGEKELENIKKPASKSHGNGQSHQQKRGTKPSEKTRETPRSKQTIDVASSGAGKPRFKADKIETAYRPEQKQQTTEKITREVKSATQGSFSPPVKPGATD